MLGTCPGGGGGGGTLKFSVYIGEADFLGVKILKFFFRVVSFLWIFFWGHAFSEFTPVPQMKTGNVLKHETMANLFMGKEYPVLI